MHFTTSPFIKKQIQNAAGKELKGFNSQPLSMQRPHLATTKLIWEKWERHRWPECRGLHNMHFKNYLKGIQPLVVHLKIKTYVHDGICKQAIVQGVFQRFVDIFLLNHNHFFLSTQNHSDFPISVVHSVWCHSQTSFSLVSGEGADTLLADFCDHVMILNFSPGILTLIHKLLSWKITILNTDWGKII